MVGYILIYLWFLHLYKIIEDGNVEGRIILNRIECGCDLFFSLSMVFIIVTVLSLLSTLLLLALFLSLNRNNNCRNNNGCELKNTVCV
jgi:hypothetical protein